jgi:hypothetical protein
MGSRYTDGRMRLSGAGDLESGLGRRHPGGCPRHYGERPVMNSARAVRQTFDG